jgi:AraC-like DNA-binding protein
MSAKSPPFDPARFLASLEPRGQWLTLFDFLPRVYLFIKDAEGRFIRMNSSSMALHGCRMESDFLGKTDFHFHPPALAAQYVEEDRGVMAAKKPVRDQVWLVMGSDRMPRWYLSTKIPLFGTGGAAVGIAGFLRPYDQTGPSPQDYRRLTPVMEYVLARYGDRIETAALAAAAHLSVSQLQREFQRLFGMTPGEYVLKVRLLMARRRLEETSDAVGDIALDCGFYDQSHFNRAFRAHVGLAPRAYRRRFVR